MKKPFTFVAAFLVYSLGLAPAVLHAQAAGTLLFIRGGTGTAGFFDGGFKDGHLCDINDTTKVAGNWGWGELGNLLRGMGFSIEQKIEGPSTNRQPVDLASLNLSQYAAIVLGSNNADYPKSQVDAVEAYVRAGGSLLVISDANWGGDWGDAPSSDQQFLDRFGLIVNQDNELYTVSRTAGDFVIGGQDRGTHPILAGPDGKIGGDDDVNSFDGEGISPFTVKGGVAGVTTTIVAKAKGTVRNNDKPSLGTTRPAAASDGTIVVAMVGNGKVIGFCDRNTFFNTNGAGTNITRFDNRKVARNLFAYLTEKPVTGLRPKFSDAKTPSSSFLSSSELSGISLTDPLGRQYWLRSNSAKWNRIWALR